MHRVVTAAHNTVGRGGGSLNGRVIAIGVAVVALMGLTACTSGTVADQDAGAASSAPGGPSSPSSDSSTPAAPALAAAITSLPAAGRKISPAEPVVIKVKHGTLTDVTMLNPAGKRVSGKLAADASSWTTTEDLGYSKTYRVAASAKNADGKTSVKHTKLTTVSPDNMTLPFINNIYGSSITSGGVYGVGMVVAVHFDESIPNKAAAEKAMTVTTTPHVNGAWYWSDSQTAHWRPKHYYKSGTKVSIHANVYGQDLGQGLYGESNVSTHFTIGRKQITVADDNAPKVDKVRVYRGGHLVKTMNTSMGKHDGTQTVNGYIDFHTMKGIYTVINFENPAHMSSESYGLPANAPGGYPAEDIPWSTKISTDGVYLHELDSTIYEQDNGIDTSHGCLNLNHDNAEWFFKHSIVGDVVRINHTGGPTITVAQGGDWSVPWSTWTKGGNA